MSTSNAHPSRLDCFGVLEEVFPLQGGGLRQTPPQCWDCSQRVECLRLAISGGESARRVNEEMARREERATGGLRGFLRRWSRLKQQRRKGRLGHGTRLPILRR